MAEVRGGGKNEVRWSGEGGGQSEVEGEQEGGSEREEGRMRWRESRKAEVRGRRAE